MREEQHMQDLIYSLYAEINQKYDEIYKLQDLESRLFIDIDNIQEEISRLQQQT